MMKRILVLITVIVSSLEVYASQETNALDHAARAFYEQSGLSKYAEQLDKKYTPKFVKEYGGWPTFIIKTVHDQKVSYKYDF